MILASHVAVVLLTGSILAASASLAGAQSAPPRARSQVATAPAGELSRARGVIKSVTAGRLVLEANPAGGAADTVFALDEKTVVQRLGKALTARDLKSGDAVTISYTLQGGKAVATRVWLRSTGGGSAGIATPGSPPAAKGR